MRSVMISGGSRGIGAAMVRRFAAAGCRVGFLYEKDRAAAAALCAETGAQAFRCDVADGETVKRTFAAFGGTDVLINNAGIAGTGLFTELTEEDWQRMIAVDLSGVFHCTQAALPYMIRVGCGRVINVSSMWGSVGASCEVAYSAAKAGVIGLTRALAKEVGPSGITVNCIAPGVIDTDMNRHLGEETLAELAEETPLGRIGTPEEVAAAAFFLASDDASFITGQVLGVNGGFVV